MQAASVHERSPRTRDVGGGAPLRLALIVARAGATAEAFASFPGTPVGFIRWAERDGRGVRTRLLDRIALESDGELLGAAVGFGRGRSLARLASRHGLDYLSLDASDPEGLRRTLERWRIDLVLTYGCALLPMRALEPATLGAVNVHPSRLPAWRGSNPYFWQIVHGQPTLDATAHRIDAGIDTGAVLARASIARPPRASWSALLRLVDERLAPALFARAIETLARDPDAPGVPQPATSPTAYARRVPLRDVDRVVPLDTLTLDRAVDLIAWYGVCPPGWLELDGWRARFDWRLGAVERRAPPSPDPAAGGRWRTVRRPGALGLRCDEGTVGLVPRTTFLRHAVRALRRPRRPGSA